MEHPFITDLSDKTLEELQETISTLMNKLTFAHRTGNMQLINQLNMAIESYRNQFNKTLDAQFVKQKIDTVINVEKG